MKADAGRCPYGMRGERAAGTATSLQVLEGRPMTDSFSKGSLRMAERGHLEVAGGVGWPLWS